MDKRNKSLDNMSFKQRKKEWKNAKKRLEPENEYLEAVTRNLELKLKHKKLTEEFQREYSEQIEGIKESGELSEEDLSK